MYFINIKSHQSRVMILVVKSLKTSINQKGKGMLVRMDCLHCDYACIDEIGRGGRIAVVGYELTREPRAVSTRAHDIDMT